MSIYLKSRKTTSVFNFESRKYMKYNSQKINNNMIDDVANGSP